MESFDSNHYFVFYFFGCQIDMKIDIRAKSIYRMFMLSLWVSNQK